MKLNFTESLF